MSMMATCSTCGKTFVAPSTFVGKRVRCKGCGEIFTVLEGGSSALAVEGSVQRELDGGESLYQLSTAIGDSQAGKATDRMDSGSDAAESVDRVNEKPFKSGFTPNVLTYSYPGAGDVDRWLPKLLIVVCFLLLLASSNGPDTKGFAWIGFVRVLAPGLLYLLCTFPLTMTMIRKAAREQKFHLPPNAQLRCFASYMPAFFLLTILQMGGDVFSLSQFFAGAIGVILSSGAVWLLFRLREEHVGTTLVYGAGGFAAGTVICLALTLGLNKMAAMAVASHHAEAFVPTSPFGQRLSWVEPPPAPVLPIPIEPAFALVEQLRSLRPPRIQTPPASH